MKTNTHITWYKRSVVNREEAYARTVIRDCFWEERKAANVMASGIIEADGLRLFIPFTSGRYDMAAGDVVVKGVVSYSVEGTFTVVDLKEQTDHVFTVRSVDVKDFGSYAMRHIEVSAA